MKEFKKGIYIGLGFLAIVLPFVFGIGIVQANTVNQSSQLQSGNTFLPNSNIYTFEQKEVGIDTAAALGSTVQSIIRNYKTVDNKVVDIVILNSATTATLSQQSILQSMYPTKIITGTTAIPAPYVTPAPIIPKK